MKWKEIAKLPTTESGLHESIFRSYQILDKVKEYMARGVPYDVIYELIEEIEDDKDKN